MALITEPDFLEKIRSNKYKIMEFFGAPDSGMTLSLFLLLRRLNRISAYISLASTNHDYRMLKDIVGKKTFIGIMNKPSIHELKNIIEYIAPYLNYLVIDDFAYYVLHKKKSEIQDIMDFLTGIINKYDVKVIIVNQYRYQLNENNNSELVRLYKNFLEPYIDLGAEVKRLDDNKENIKIRASFTKTRFSLDNLIPKFLREQE